MPYITIDNRKISFQSKGDGFPIIFGHSYLWDSKMWDLQVETLSKSYRCILPDLWSHGKSESRDADECTLDHIADHFWKFTQALGLREFGIVGHSIGGMWGAKLAAMQPNAVKALVLLNTYAGKERPDAKSEYLSIIETVKNQGFSEKALDKIIPYFFSHETLNTNKRLVEKFRESLENIPAENIPGITSIGQHLFERASGMEELKRIKTPTLIIAGEEDTARTPEESDEMASTLPHAHVERIEGAAHMTTLEKPTQVTKLLLTYLNEALNIRMAA